ncbi:MAG: glycosyltransferase family 2 protein, partial [Chitinophagaceae bacterium]
IEAAIICAKGELIVATDADCTVPPGWLTTINDFYTFKGAAFIAAPVRFTYTRSILQIFQALDFMVLQGITAAAVSGSFHSMCNGANLAYTKQAFDEVEGFIGINQVASGDDMLLMYKVWQRYPQNVHYLKSKQTIVQTGAMPTWKLFFGQRIRWASKTMHYTDKRVLAVLVFVYAFNVLFFVLLAAGFFSATYWQAALLYWIVKTGIELPFTYAISEFYEEKRLLPYFFFFQPLHMLYTVSIGLLSQLGRYEWKGRLTK